jgi:hypothetical protein
MRSSRKTRIQLHQIMESEAVRLRSKTGEGLSRPVGEALLALTPSGYQADGGGIRRRLRVRVQTAEPQTSSTEERRRGTTQGASADTAGASRVLAGRKWWAESGRGW